MAAIQRSEEMKDSMTIRGNSPVEGHEGRDDRGEVLIVFRPKTYINDILGWLVLAMGVIALIVYFTGESGENADREVFVAMAFGIPLAIIILYLLYITVFDDIIILEKGLYPPRATEREWNILLMRRTFIPFSAMHNIIINWPPIYPQGIVFSAFDKTWRISGKWDFVAMVPLLQSGVVFGALQPPPSHDRTKKKSPR